MFLKPCDDAKIIPVLDKAARELEEQRQSRARSQKMEREARLFKPIAREQLFRDTLLGRAQPAGKRQLLAELGEGGRQVILLDFRLTGGFDALERYVIGICWETCCPTAPC